MPSKEQILEKYFGYKTFRRGQDSLIDAVLSGRDALGIMPTGAGKSVCYQVPAMLMDGLTVVISPLISLMKDQVQALNAGGIPAAFINSTLSAPMMREVMDGARYGEYKLIYVAPERLDAPDFVSLSSQVGISMVTVDEAHCVSQWGQDFRPSYLKISDYIAGLPVRPVVSAFTATATEEVKRDIIRMLDLRDPHIVATGFDRENLYFEVRKPRDKYAELTSYLKENPDRSGIIYCATRKTVEQVCEKLQDGGYSATRYHAGLGEDERSKNQDDFLYDRKTVMVATNAFGMGIDKSNVGFVVHYNMPKNIESYYQEAGRAGRDGSPADCVLLYGGQDVITNQFFIEHTNEHSELDAETLEQVKAKDRERLRLMTYYCQTTDCLRAYILRYFGDECGDECGNCSSCRRDYDTADVLTESKKILSCIYRMQERYGIKLLVDTLRGSKNERIRELGLDGLSTYGIMKEASGAHIRDIINFLVLRGYIVLTDTEFPVAKLGGDYRKLLKSEAPLLMKVSREDEEEADSRGQHKSRRAKREARGKDIRGVDQALLRRLKEERLRIAADSGIPAFMVFSDATLVDMCRKRPENKAQMLDVSGIGEVKYERYGQSFLRIIGDADEPEDAESLSELTDEEVFAFVRENFIPSADDIPVSALADMLNALLLHKSGYKVSAVKLAKFYEDNGFLEVITLAGRNMKISTEKGRKLGITTEERVSSRGDTYRGNFYGASAQRYAAERIHEVLEM